MINAQENNNIIAPGATIEKIGEGFSFTEGPAVDQQDNVYFTDQPNDRIWKWSVDTEQLSVSSNLQDVSMGCISTQTTVA